jgi:hypothetical protein
MQSAEHRQQEVLVELDVSWKHPQDWRWRLPLHAALLTLIENDQCCSSKVTTLACSG